MAANPFKWVRTHTETSTDPAPCVRQRITYKSAAYPDWVLYSVQHAEPHATYNSTYWGHHKKAYEWCWNDYIAVRTDGNDLHTFHRLCDATQYVAETTDKENLKEGRA